MDPEREQSGAEEDDDEDGFTNFEQITRQNKERDASEGCAQLERATQLLLQLDLEFLEGVDVPMVQVRSQFMHTNQAIGFIFHS